MTWASDRRLDFIDHCLALRGEVQRADIMRVFGVSEAQASQDISAFGREHPGAMSYDKSAKRYVPARSRYKRQRNGAWTRAIDWAAIELTDRAKSASLGK